MTLGAAWPLLLLGLAVPIVVAFLRRPPPRRRRVSSLLLVRALASAPARRQRPPLRELIALLLFLLALLSSTAGLALRPAAPPRSVLVVLDTSASGAPGRAAALDTLRAALRGQTGAPLSVIATAPARLLLASTSDHSGALAQLTLERLPAEGVEDTAALDRLLAALCDVAPRPPHLLALHDAPLPAGLACSVERPPLPARGDNQGITALSLRAADGLGLLEVHLATAGTAPTTLVLSADGAPAGTISLPAAPAERLLRLSLPGAATLEARLPGDDAWAGDDRVRAAIPQAPPVRTLLLTQAPEGFAAAALRAHPRVDLTAAAEPPSPSAPDTGWDLVVVEGTATAAALPSARRVVLLGAEAPALGIQHERALQRPEVRVQDPQAPLLRYTDLEQLHIARGWSLRAPAEAAVLLASPQGPLAVQTDTLLALGFVPDDTDLVLRTAFVNLMANAVEWAMPPLPPPAPPEGILSATETTAAPLPADQDAAVGLLGGGQGVRWGAGLAALLAALLMLAEWPLQRPATTSQRSAR